MADELQQPGSRREIVKSQDNIERVSNADIPEFLKPMIESGEITQWREFPNRFFVNGVDKARIIWHTDEQEFGYAYLNELPKEQFEKIPRYLQPYPYTAQGRERASVQCTGGGIGKNRR